jgi:hypothetical protein
VQTRLRSRQGQIIEEEAGVRGRGHAARQPSLAADETVDLHQAGCKLACRRVNRCCETALRRCAFEIGLKLESALQGKTRELSEPREIGYFGIEVSFHFAGTCFPLEIDRQSPRGDPQAFQIA